MSKSHALPELEQVAPADVKALLDLRAVRAEERASVWTGTVPSLFPGLSVKRIADCTDEGRIRRITLDQGELWAVRSPSARVSFSPNGLAFDRHLTVMLQLAGRTEVEQRHRACVLAPGDLCLVDERFAFAIEGDAAAEILFMRLPREITLGRHPHLEHHTATALPAGTAGTAIVARMLSATLDCGPFLDDPQQRAALAGTIELLGTLDCRADTGSHRGRWRVEAALSFIEVNFARGGLGAEEVAQAQRISRRRLDHLLSELTGASVTSHIWRRRLAHASADLRDPRRAGCTASQIAFANGFEDAAHFTRAFKRSYGLSPQQWRAQGHADASTCDKRPSQMDQGVGMAASLG